MFTKIFSLENIVTFLLLLILSYFTLTIFKQDTTSEIDKSNEPLFTIEGYDMSRFGEQGLPIYRIEGPYMEHFEIKGSMLKEPFLTHFADNLIVNWTVKSDSAHISSDQSLTTLNENVILKDYSRSNENPTTLLTSLLFIHNKGEKITNNVFTKILHPPQNTLEGVGVLGYPSTGEFKLLKDVTSSYETIQN